MQEVVCRMAGSIGTGVLHAPACFGIPGAGGMRGARVCWGPCSCLLTCVKGRYSSVCLKLLNVSAAGEKKIEKKAAY